MEIVEIDTKEITIGDRARKELDLNEDFLTSIKEFQINPILLRREGNLLIAGERRVRACEKLGIKVKAIYKDECSLLELRELELRENVDRKDMTWIERCNAIAEIDKLKRAEHGDATAGRSSKGWGTPDTAGLLKKGLATVHDAIQIAKAVQVLPELAECKSQAEAQKKLDKLIEKHAIAELVKRNKESRAGKTIEADKHFIVGDAFAGMKTLHSESVDFINCDTPYAVDLGEQKKIQTEHYRVEDYKEWTREEFVSNITIIATECFRVLRDNSWMTFWFGQEHYQAVREVLIKAGFKIDKIPAVWYGGTAGAQTIAAEVNLGRSYEQFFICRKGTPSLLKKGRPNVFAYDKIPPQKKIHPTEKPIGLMIDILETFVLPGSTCVSPFIGSGNDLRAAYKYGCNPFGFDLNQDVKNKFLLRVQDDVESGFYS